MSKHPKMTISTPGPNESVSFPSAGPVINMRNEPVTSDHSVLTDVAGSQVWLHKDKHHFDGDGNVHMPFHHAVDMGLAEQPEADPVVIKPPVTDTPVTKLEPGKSGHDAKTYKEDDKGKVTPTTSAMSNTSTDVKQDNKKSTAS